MKSHVALALCLFSLLPLASAQSATAPDPQAIITTNSTLVLVPALVRDKRGNLVFTLTANDFALTDDGIPQKLTLEPDTGGEPLALVVDIEGGGAGAREILHQLTIGECRQLDEPVGAARQNSVAVCRDK